jgi:hypothetical protein
LKALQAAGQTIGNAGGYSHCGISSGIGGRERRNPNTAPLARSGYGKVVR